MSKRVNIASWPVMRKKCPTCPFRPDSPLAEHRGSVEARLLDSSQICHHPVLHGKKEDHLCRGARDIQLEILFRLGVIREATDEAWEDEAERRKACQT